MVITTDTRLEELTFRIVGKKIQLKYIIIFTVFITTISCRKNEISQEIPACNISKSIVGDPKADSVVYKYNKDNKLSEVINYGYSCGLKWVFTYPKLNQLVVTYQSECPPDYLQEYFPVVIDFNAAGQVIEMNKNPSNGYTISLEYSGNNIVSLLWKTQRYSRETRFEYIGNNVTKVSTTYEGNPTFLNFEGLKYDNMKTLYTKEYMLLRLYVSTFTIGDMYDFLSQNNVLSYNRYLGSGPPVDRTERTIEYNSNQYPTKIISKITTPSVSYSTTVNYQYSCQ